VFAHAPDILISILAASRRRAQSGGHPSPAPCSCCVLWRPGTCFRDFTTCAPWARRGRSQALPAQRPLCSRRSSLPPTSHACSLHPLSLSAPLALNVLPEPAHCPGGCARSSGSSLQDILFAFQWITSALYRLLAAFRTLPAIRYRSSLLALTARSSNISYTTNSCSATTLLWTAVRTTIASGLWPAPMPQAAILLEGRRTAVGSPLDSRWKPATNRHWHEKKKPAPKHLPATVALTQPPV